MASLDAVNSAAISELREGITVSTKGRFHAFDLARELQSAGCLRHLITSLPAWYAARFGVDKRRVTSLVPVEILDRTLARIPRIVKAGLNPQYFVSDTYDKLAALRLHDPGKIFVGWSSFSLHTLRKARSRGAVIVVERGSSHIEYQRDILAEEYRRFGVISSLPHPQVVEKELAEYAEADFIAVPSRFVCDTFRAKGFPEEKLIHVPYGVDTLKFSPLGKQDSIFRIIYCGGITVRKGVHYLLRAFAELRLPGAELWLIGALSEESRAVLGPHLSPGVRHLGPFPQPELAKYYSQGSVFCMPSIEEGLAMVQAQAMACGLPVICTTNTGGGDIVRDGIDGYVIPIRDVGAIKEKILGLYEDPEKRCYMAQSARKRVETGFSWGDYGKAVLKAYVRALHRAAKPS